MPYGLLAASSSKRFISLEGKQLVCTENSPLGWKTNKYLDAVRWLIGNMLQLPTNTV